MNITVFARPRWNHTGFQLTAGLRYRIEVFPNQRWKDWYIDFGPEGGTSGLQHLTAGMLRLKNDGSAKAQYFTLIGTIGESHENAFIIGKGPCDFIAPISGEFVCFANDIWAGYWNNSGSIKISIQ